MKTIRKSASSRKRKAAKPVMAWGMMGLTRDGVEKLLPYAGPVRVQAKLWTGCTRIVRVRIVEVRR